MTVLTFPSSPIIGQRYNAPNEIQYVFDGVKWIVETVATTSAAVTNSVQDRIAPMFVDGPNTGITFTYNAATNVMSSAVTAINGNQLVNGVRSLTLESNGNITTPAFTIPNAVGTSGQVLKWPGSGTTLVWSADSSIAISDFGRGFTNTLDSGKITTNKLYNRPANLALNNHFELSVDNGGVVHLPDQSVINGATLKSVAGNYAGITSGPVGKDEDSWVWVDNGGAWIATDYSDNAYTWNFGNDGTLTLPPDGTISNTVGGIKLVTGRGTLAIGTNMEVPGVAGHFHIAFDESNINPPPSDLFLGDDYNYVKLPGSQLDQINPYGVEIGAHNRGGPQNVEVQTVDELVPPGGVWRLFIDDGVYPTLGTTVEIGDTVTTSWGTPITATIIDVVQLDGDWRIHVDQDITAGHNDYDTVSFGSPGNSYNWRFGTNGKLTLPAGGDIVDSTGTTVLGGGSTSYTPDDTDNWNVPSINTISAALDELALRLTAVENIEIEGGNAYAMAGPELILDGNGA